MSEWWTYRPSDFLLFAPRVYYRLIETQNAALWPLHVVLIGLGAALLVAVLRPQRALDRVALGALGLVWLHVGFAFVWQRYAAINWAAAYAAPAFAVQGVVLLAAAARMASSVLAHPALRRAAAAGLLVLAVAAYPALSLAAGRPWPAAEVFGVAPDPTAIATLGAALAAPRPWAVVLAPVPLLWCALSAATLGVMGAPEAWIVAGAGLLGVAAFAIPPRVVADLTRR